MITKTAIQKINDSLDEAIKTAKQNDKNAYISFKVKLNNLKGKIDKVRLTDLVNNNKANIGHTLSSSFIKKISKISDDGFNKKEIAAEV